MTLYFIPVVGGTSKKHGRAIWVVSMEKGAKKMIFGTTHASCLLLPNPISGGAMAKRLFLW